MYGLAHVIVLTSVIIIVLYIYNDTVGYSFTFDDHLAIESNGDVSNAENNLWLHDIWGKDMLEHDSHQSYRPLLIIFFTFLWNLNPHSTLLFHIMSIFFFILCSFLFYLAFSAKYPWDPVIIASILFFTTHPIHIEAVTAVVNMAEPAYSALGLAAFIAYQIAYNAKSSLPRLFYTFISLLCMILSILMKETGIIFCIMIVGHIVSRKVVQSIALVTSSTKQLTMPVRPKAKEIVWIFLPSMTIYVYFGVRSVLTNPQRQTILSSTTSIIYHMLFYLTDKQAPTYLNSSQLIRRAENPFAFLVGNEKVLSYLYLYYRYFMLLLYPHEQSPEYSFNCISAVSSLQDIRNIYSLTLTLAIFALVFHSIYKAVLGEQKLLAKYGSKKSNQNYDQYEVDKIRRKAYFLMDSLMWLLVPFFPLTGILFKLGTLLAERLLFLPSVGFCLLQAYLLYFMLRKIMKTLAVPKSNFIVCYYALSISISSYYIYKAKEYNPQWENDSKLFLHTIKVCPESAKSQLQVSKLYSLSPQDLLLNLTLAWHHLNESQRIDPDFCDTDHQAAYLLVLEANAVQAQGKRILDYDDKISRAIESLLKNLHCVYTNAKSLELLQQLWPHQMEYTKMLASSNKDDVQSKVNSMMIKQAKQAYKHELYALAAQKFLEIGLLMVDQKNLLGAIKHIKYANRAVESYYSYAKSSNLHIALQTTHMSTVNVSTVIPSEGKELQLVYIMQCKAWSLLASMIQAYYNVSDSALEIQVKDYARQASNAECLYAAKQMSSRISDTTYLPIQLIRSAASVRLKFVPEPYSIAILLNSNLDTIENEILLDYITAVSILLLYEENRVQSAQKASALWSTLGERYYKAKDFALASQYYLLSLLLSLTPLPSVESLFEALSLFSPSYPSPLPLHTHYLSLYNASLSYDYRLQPDCHVFYYYADSLAGRGEFFSVRRAVIVVRDVLFQCQRCLRVQAKPKALDPRHEESVQFLVDKFVNFASHE